MIAIAEPAAGVDLPSARKAERELKFTLPAGSVDLVRRWLGAMCRPDPKYPAAMVWTIYYDTVELESLNEKINSDYLKLKIRLRWYSELGRPASGPVFMEAKLRTGTERAKVRVTVPHTAETIASWSLQDPRFHSLPSLLRSRGIVLRGMWLPLLLVRYRRDRFFDPISRARISLDAHIAAAAVNPTLISRADGSPLGLGVLEVKGAMDRLPAALEPILRLGARKRSFSKLLAVHRHMTHSNF
jgi:hypothetical protein